MIKIEVTELEKNNEGFIATVDINGDTYNVIRKGENVQKVLQETIISYVNRWSDVTKKELFYQTDEIIAKKGKFIIDKKENDQVYGHYEYIA